MPSLRTLKTGQPRVRGVAPIGRRTVDNIVFQSRGEMLRYLELKLLLQAGSIKTLERQVPFPLIVNGQQITTYYADFTYFLCGSGDYVVEDAKGYRREGYRLKKQLVKALYNIDILETSVWRKRKGGVDGL